MRRLLVVGLLACAPLLGCADKTAIQAVVTSETLEIPADVTELSFDITGSASGAMVVDRRFAVSTDWPHSLSIRPGSRDDEEIAIVVTAWSGGTMVTRAERAASFVPGETVVVEIVLGPPGAGDGGFDGGIDAAVDAGDGGPPGCLSSADCDDGVRCTSDSCTGGACLNTPDNASCADGTTCDPVDDCPPRTCATDEDCNDSRACNGDETCVDGACAPGMALTCDDMDACTDDRCDNSLRGCVASTRDADGDGFGDAACTETGGVPASDCNDASPDIFPGAPESCNGADDDCNDVCDDSFTCCRGESGSCTTTCGTTGMRVCSATCSWGVCSPPAEICNGVDDDCNDSPDDVFACVRGASRSCTTGCGSMGTQTCGADCTWNTCAAPAETCNGLDDDCDGMPDDGFSCVAGSTSTCSTSCGSTGSRTCSSTTCTLGTCAAPPEACNGADDDCDGSIDETVECSPGTVQSCTTSCGTTGSRTCSSMCTYPACTPPAEACNGLDDNCNGSIDETFTCVRGATGTCSTSCGTTGTRTCGTSCSWGTCAPPVEACNGVDDDCDTRIDETFACPAGGTGSCTTSCGTSGSRTCSASCAWSACSPPAEACNGMDDDCNGACDDGFACCAGSSGSCTTTCGSTGTRSCSGSCAWSACAPPTESCNGADDDCDGTVDDGFSCVAGEMRSCTTSCGSTGSQTCTSPGCTWSTCAPPTESCNGVDDDCDGMTDEGCGGCTACTGAVTMSAPGGRYTASLVPNAQTGTCGGAGSEAYFTFTLTARSDVFLTTHQSGIDTVLYVRNCSCTGMQAGCNDDADGLTSSALTLTNLAAGTYNVIVDTKTAMSGMVTLDAYMTETGAVNDRCGRPTFIPAATTTISGNTCMASNDYDASIADACASTYAGDAADHVYYFYVSSPQTFSVNGCLASNVYDNVVYVRNVCTTAGVANQVACVDDGCGGSPACNARYRSSMERSLGRGLYYLVVDGFDNGAWPCPCGDYAFAISRL